MPTTVTYTKTLYQFDELSESAKATARDWFRECMECSDMDHVIEDATECASLLGIEIDKRTYKTMGGGTGTESAIAWGLHVQGSGASFTGSYRYKQGAAKAIREHAPQDETLHRIADTLQAIQRKHFYKLEARITKGNDYYPHSGTMRVSVSHLADDCRDIGEETEDKVTDCLREFADWIYAQIDAEWDYQTSDECVAENILANEYTFNEFGKRED